MSREPEHSEWEERLQDRIDGDLNPALSAALDEHVAGCARCRALMSTLTEMDEALRARFLKKTLSSSFDRQVLDQVTCAARADRAAARERAEREWRAQMAVLSQQWRTTLSSLALNISAAVGLLVALIKTLGSLAMTHGLVDRAGLFVQHVVAHPAMTMPVAAILAAATVWLTRILAAREE